jgi:hypothetical protein
MLQFPTIFAITLSRRRSEPPFDSVAGEFLVHQHRDLEQRVARGGLLDFAVMGQRAPWLYRLHFATKGLVLAASGEIESVESHVVAVRFLPDYLRRANRFEMLALIEPHSQPAFHPNIHPTGAICVEVYPGEPIAEIAQSLHDLIRWRLRQYDERDALNPDACAYGRDHIDQPIDDRPLFGRKIGFTLEPRKET